MKHIICSILLVLLIIFIADAQWLAQSSSGDNNYKSCHIDDWTALKALYENTNGDGWRIKNGWETTIANHNIPPVSCDLSNITGVTLNAYGRVAKLDLNPGNKDMSLVQFTNSQEQNFKYPGLGNNLRGSIPNNLNLLAYLELLDLGSNHLEGLLPVNLEYLTHLNTVVFNDNNLTGKIPSFANSVSYLNIAGNQFTRYEVSNFLSNNWNETTSPLVAPRTVIHYSPQYFEHKYGPYIVDVQQDNNFSIDFSEIVQNNPNGIFKWNRKNEYSPILNLIDVSPSDAGVYTFHIKDFRDIDLELISKPVYVIYPGYDFSSQEVISNQIMVEFDNKEDTEFYEKEILFPNAGFVADTCICNRELYLWEFNTEENLVQALIEIDESSKLASIDDEDEGEVDGGFNSTVVLDSTFIQIDGFNVKTELKPNEDYNDEVAVFILDTGLDETNCTGNNNIEAINKTDICYENTSNIDKNGHGTIGYNLISDGLSNLSNIKITSIKTFNDNGRGDLYRLVCDLYHSIDNNANIINISAGYYGQESDILTKAINTAREQNIFICTAAGNDENNIDIDKQFPASYAGMYHYTYDEKGSLM